MVVQVGSEIVIVSQSSELPVGVKFKILKIAVKLENLDSCLADIAII